MTEILQSQLNKSRKDKFLMVITLPKILKSINTADLSVRAKDILNMDSLQFSIFGTVVPTIQVPAVVAGYAGQSFKASSHSRPPYEDIAVSFTIDNKFNNYWAMYKWLDILNDDAASYYNAGDLPDVPAKKTVPANYQADITVYALDEFDAKVMKFTYTKAFPVALGGITYSYRDPEEIESSFTFAFSQFIPEPL